MSVRRLDLVQPAGFSFAPENASRAKRAIAKFPAGKQASAVIQLLWFAQEQEGWVSRPAIEAVSRAGSRHTWHKRRPPDDAARLRQEQSERRRSEFV